MSEENFCRYLPSSRRSKSRRSRKSKASSTKKSEEKTTSAFLMTPGPSRTSSKKKTSNVLYVKDRTARHQGYAFDNKSKINASDYNIFHIDTKIREKLSLNISTISELQQDLKKTLWILNNGGNPTDRVLAKQQVNIIRKRIQDLESTFELLFYQFKTSDLLDEYRKLLSKSGAKSFITLNYNNDDPGIARRNQLVSQFLCIAQEYIELENVNQRPQKLVCLACGCIDFTLSPDEDSIYICKECNTQVEILDDTPSFKDTDRVNLATKYTYTKKGHFIDAMKRFQGKQNADPKKIDTVVKILLEEMSRHNLTNENVTKDHLYMFLAEKSDGRDLSKHYDDINLLFHIITSEPCPDISQYEDDLLDDFDIQEATYEEIIEEDRQNSLNVNYKLYKLLQRRGYPCKKDDFYFLKTKTKEGEHDEILKRVWEKIGWLPWICTW